jgi:uncharacterized membrane protein (DUF373 family)
MSEGSDPTPRSEDQIGGVTAADVAKVTDGFVHVVELAAAALFAFLFAVGVVDLALQIVQSIQSGRITDPLVVIGFIDTGLLLLIIVEVYQTVIAYTQQSDTRKIVRLVIYTGVIAMVRKVIIFRTGEYATTQDAALVALSYTIIIAGLVGLLLVERVYGEGLLSVVGADAGSGDRESGDGKSGDSGGPGDDGESGDGTGSGPSSP